MLEMLMTQEVYPSLSSLPLESSPRKAIVTKYTEEVLMLYSEAHSSKDSFSNIARPSVSGD